MHDDDVWSHNSSFVVSRWSRMVSIAWSLDGICEYLPRPISSTQDFLEHEKNIDLSWPRQGHTFFCIIYKQMPHWWTIFYVWLKYNSKDLRNVGIRILLAAIEWSAISTSIFECFCTWSSPSFASWWRLGWSGMLAQHVDKTSRLVWNDSRLYITNKWEEMHEIRFYGTFTMHM